VTFILLERPATLRLQFAAIRSKFQNCARIFGKVEQHGSSEDLVSHTSHSEDCSPLMHYAV
jgi:hypothetical protein